MNKRLLHHWLVRVRSVPHWGLFVAALFMLFISVFALRANNQKMIELRQAVFVADEQDGDVESALRDLREHVYAHMNTNLASGENTIKPPIQLKYRYERLLEAERSKTQTGGSDLYTAAQNHCEQRFPGGFSGSNRLPCIREYLDSHGVGGSEDINIPEDLYKFDFVSPTWSPDLAGWSLVLSAALFTMLAIRLIAELAIKNKLSH